MKIFVILAATAMLTINGIGSKCCMASEIQLEERFQKAEDILFNLLLPNSMARTEPRTEKEEQNLLHEFRELSATFAKDPETSVSFLRKKLHQLKSTDDADAICALELLYELNTESSRKLIRDAQKHPEETVSRLAKEMVTQRRDLLSGFNSKEGR